MLESDRLQWLLTQEAAGDYECMVVVLLAPRLAAPRSARPGLGQSIREELHRQVDSAQVLCQIAHRDVIDAGLGNSPDAFERDTP